MPIQIKDIKGALVEKVDGLADGRVDFCEGFNFAIDQIGEVKIGLNREKLARQCYINCGFDRRPWLMVPESEKDMYFIMADNIIAEESEILEVKE